MTAFVTPVLPSRSVKNPQYRTEVPVCRVKTAENPRKAVARRRRISTALPAEYTQHALLTAEQEREISQILAQHRRQQAVTTSYATKNGRPPSNSQLSKLLNLPEPKLVEQKNKAIRARNRLVSANLRLVSQLATRIHKSLSASQKTGLPLHDLIQEACITLIRSAELYDSSYGRFSSYAHRAIRSACMRHVTAHSIVSIPVRLRRQLKQGNKEEQRKEGEWDANGDKLLQAARRMSTVLELDRLISDSSTILDILPSNFATPAQQLQRQDMIDEIRKACRNRLSERDADILALRYGMGVEKKSGREIAKRFGISEARVAQIVKRSVETLHLEEKGLMQYLTT